MAKKPGRLSQKQTEAWWSVVRPKLARLLSDARYRAKRKGTEFNLKVEDLRVPERCPALGVVLRWDDGAPLDLKPSLDRIDNSKGYTRQNTRIVSFRANYLKGNATPKEVAGLLSYMEGEDD